MSKLKTALEERDYLKAKRLIMDNPKYLEENVDYVLGAIKELSRPIRFSKKDNNNFMNCDPLEFNHEGRKIKGVMVSPLKMMEELFISGINKSGILGEDNIMAPIDPGSPHEQTATISELVDKRQAEMLKSVEEAVDNATLHDHETGKVICKIKDIGADCLIPGRFVLKTDSNKITDGFSTQQKASTWHDKERAHEEAIKENLLRDFMNVDTKCGPIG